LRLQGPVEDPDTEGVLSLTRRLTGEYLLEANAQAPAILDVVDAARERHLDRIVQWCEDLSELSEEIECFSRL
jgi:hypothetical protein